jgi:hypothetical protein
LRVKRHEVLQDPVKWGTHVVLLGAGASRASLSCGDRRGLTIPLMDDLDSIVGPGWNTLLAKFEVKTRGFERQYSELRKLPGAADDLASFDEVLREYF